MKNSGTGGQKERKDLSTMPPRPNYLDPNTSKAVQTIQRGAELFYGEAALKIIEVLGRYDPKSEEVQRELDRYGPLLKALDQTGEIGERSRKRLEVLLMRDELISVEETPRVVGEVQVAEEISKEHGTNENPLKYDSRLGKQVSLKNLLRPLGVKWKYITELSGKMQNGAYEDPLLREHSQKHSGGRLYENRPDVIERLGKVLVGHGLLEYIPTNGRANHYGGRPKKTRVEEKSREGGVKEVPYTHGKAVRDVFGDKCNQRIAQTLFRLIKSGDKDLNEVFVLKGPPYYVAKPGVTASQIREVVRSKLQSLT